MYKFIAISTFILFSNIALAQTCYLSSMTQEKPNSIYTDNGDGTITDKETGLMWQKCTKGLSGTNCTTGSATSMNWSAAFVAAQTAKNTVEFGYNDWRVPNIKELMSLFETACSFPALNETLFPATVADYFWAGTGYQPNGQYAWAVTFQQNYYTYQLKTNLYYLRLVRTAY